MVNPIQILGEFQSFGYVIAGLFLIYGFVRIRDIEKEIEDIREKFVTREILALQMQNLNVRFDELRALLVDVKNNQKERK